MQRASPREHKRGKSKTVRRKSRTSRTSFRKLAPIRLAEIYRLALLRREHGLRIDNGSFLWTMAATLSVVRPSGKGSGHWAPSYGLDILTLREAIRRANLGDDGAFYDDELMDIIHQFDEPKWISPEKLGELLELTAAERQECKIRTMEACDETKLERRARQGHDRRERDRERKRRQRGSKPRQPASEPWQALGMSKSTYYRRQSQGETECPHTIGNGTTYPQGAVSVRYSQGGTKCPRTIIDITSADNQSHTGFHTVAGPARFDEREHTAAAGVPSAHWAAEGVWALAACSLPLWRHPGEWSADPLTSDPFLDEWADEVAGINRERVSSRNVAGR